MTTTANQFPDPAPDELLAALKDGPLTTDPYEMLAAMEKVREAFYWSAFRIGVHGFIEFAGLIGEYINICRRTLDSGVDFTQCNTHSGQPLKVAEYQAAYLAEKLECIYGSTLASDPKLRAQFMAGMGLDEP